MPKFKGGVSVNNCNSEETRYLRISAGPQRGEYVHDLVLEAKIGRRLQQDETAEHADGNGLNCRFDNILGPVTREHNTRLARQREKRKKKMNKAKLSEGDIRAMSVKVEEHLREQGYLPESVVSPEERHDVVNVIVTAIQEFFE